MDLTRRNWLLASLGSAAWTAIADAQTHAHSAVTGEVSARFEFLDRQTAADLSAIASQILPSVESPGATEAGVIYFIDRALTTFAADQQETYAKGIAEWRATSHKMFPASESIASLTGEQQLALMHAIDKTEFFDVVRTHTLLGFLGNPSYGGNRNSVGWKHIGFDDRMAWQPPFGYYDAEAK
jgi:gluconate 2-dehydrogenase gamma chain